MPVSPVLSVTLLILAGSAASAPDAFGASWSVHPDGSGDAPTIQAGIDSAAAGDTVLVEDGRFTGPGNRGLDLLGKGLVLRSRNGAAACTLDAEGADRLMVLQTGETSLTRIEGFTIRNGWTSSFGGGIYCQDTSPVIADCRFLDNYAGDDGGGICFEGAFARVERCRFDGNEAGDHGGGIVNFNGANTEIEECFFVSNHATTGGGLSAFRSSITARHCTLTMNAAAVNGGGLSLWNRSRWGATVEDCVITYNEADEYGGGVLISTGQPTIVRTLIRGNTAPLRGGGVSVAYEGNGLLRECVIDSNLSGFGGGIRCARWTGPRFEDCSIDANQGAQGGGLSAYQASPEFVGCLFTHNLGTVAGAVHLEQSTPLFESCTMYGNGGQDAGGIYSELSTTTVANSIIAFSVEGRGFHKYFGGTAVLSCSDLYGNAGGDWVGGIAGQAGANGNFSEDPLFCAPSAGDFTLDASSPCLADPGCGPIGALGAGCDVATDVAEGAGETLPRMLLVQNAPNPFNPTTRISFSTRRIARVELTIYDVGGRTVSRLVDDVLPAGNHETVWRGIDGDGVPVGSGIYIAHLRSAGATESIRMTLLR